jgi:peroxiredoxin
MRRRAIAVLFALVVAVAISSWWASRRELVVERPSLGGPPPNAHPQVSLVGRAAPAFEAADLNGRAVGTTALRGRVAVLNVWATWCQPCVEELPRLEREVWQRFQPHVAVVGVAQGEDAAKVREYNRHAMLTFALVEDPDGAIARCYGGEGMIPRTYVIDRNGVVVHQTIGYGDRSFLDLVSAVERAVAQR